MFKKKCINVMSWSVIRQQRARSPITMKTVYVMSAERRCLRFKMSTRPPGDLWGEQTQRRNKDCFVYQTDCKV